MQSPAPILAYETGPAAGRNRVRWQEDGAAGAFHFELDIAPPAPWQLVVVQLLKLLLLVPFVGFAVVWAVLWLTQTPVAAVLPIGVAVAGLAVAAGSAGAFARVVRTAHRPFTVAVDADGLRLMDPGWYGPSRATGFEFDEPLEGTVAGVQFFRLTSNPFYGAARLVIAFDDGRAISADIPIRDDEPLQPVEDLLTHVLVHGQLPVGPAVEGLSCAS